MSSQMRVSNDHYEWSLQARSFPLPTAAPERDTERAAWVNPKLPFPPHSRDEITSI
jgi:hypothetical protein